MNSFCIAHNFIKNNNVFENTLATTVKEFVINELIKLTMLCSTGPWTFLYTLSFQHKIEIT